MTNSTPAPKSRISKFISKHDVDIVIATSVAGGIVIGVLGGFMLGEASMFKKITDEFGLHTK